MQILNNTEYYIRFPCKRLLSTIKIINVSNDDTILVHQFSTHTFDINLCLFCEFCIEKHVMSRC